MLILLAKTLGLGQVCKLLKVDYDPVDITEITVLQNQKTEVETSQSYIDIFYGMIGATPAGYRLVIDINGSYRLIEVLTDNSPKLIKSGFLRSAEIEKIKSVEINGENYSLTRCKSITSSEGAEFFLIKKIGLVEIYSLDAELENTIKENKNELGLITYLFDLLNCMIKQNSN